MDCRTYTLLRWTWKLDAERGGRDDQDMRSEPVDRDDQDMRSEPVDRDDPTSKSVVSQRSLPSIGRKHVGRAAEDASRYGVVGG